MRSGGTRSLVGWALAALALLGLVLTLAAWVCVIAFAIHVPPPWRWWAIGYAAALALVVIVGNILWPTSKNEVLVTPRRDLALAASIFMPLPMIPALVAAGLPWGLIGASGFAFWIISELISRVMKTHLRRNVRARRAPSAGQS
jgi:hypothetical protein